MSDIALETQTTPDPPAPAVLLPPTPDEIDDWIRDYEILCTAATTADLDQEAAKKHLIFLTDSFGQVPPHAEQSRRLVGRRNTVTVTRGTTITVNEDGVAALDAYLVGAGQGSLFSRFFATNLKHTLVEGARDVLKTITLPLRVEEKVASLFGKAFDIKSKKPSVKIDTVEPAKPVKKPRGGKAAA